MIPLETEYARNKQRHGVNATAPNPAPSINATGHRPGRRAWRVLGGAFVALLVVSGPGMGQQASLPEAAIETAAAPAVPANGAGKERIENKLKSIRSGLDIGGGLSLESAIDTLRGISEMQDKEELDSAKKGINFVIRSYPDHVKPGELKIRDMLLSNVSLGTLLQILCDQTQMRYIVDDHAVILIPRNEGVKQAVAKRAPAGSEEKTAVWQHKLDSIILPSIQLRHNTLDYAVDLLRRNAIELDVAENDPAKKGIKFFFHWNRGEWEPQTRVIHALKLKNVPIGTALQYICDQTDMFYFADENGVYITPKY